MTKTILIILAALFCCSCQSTRGRVFTKPGVTQAEAVADFRAAQLQAMRFANPYQSHAGYGETGSAVLNVMGQNAIVKAHMQAKGYQLTSKRAVESAGGTIWAK